MTTTLDEHKPLILDELPLLGPERVAELGSTLVIAPHPDDESLGCGGLISLLVDAGMPARVIVMSDGCGSHPNSRAYPPAVLQDLREAETAAAVAELGVCESALHFLRLPDTRVPGRQSSGFDAAVHVLGSVLTRCPRPETVLLPWRRDPHHDHRTTWQIVHAALSAASIAPRVIEYPIWLWDDHSPDDAPCEGEMRGWRLDIEPVLPRKLLAIARHRSQTTNLIQDDPDGFQLSAQILAHFKRPWETFLEPVDG